MVTMALRRRRLTTMPGTKLGSSWSGSSSWEMVMAIRLLIPARTTMVLIGNGSEAVVWRILMVTLFQAALILNRC